MGSETGGLPRPAVVYADHSYPAFSAKQVRSYAQPFIDALQVAADDLHEAAEAVAKIVDGEAAAYLRQRCENARAALARSTQVEGESHG